MTVILTTNLGGAGPRHLVILKMWPRFHRSPLGRGAANPVGSRRHSIMLPERLQPPKQHPADDATRWAVFTFPSPRSSPSLLLDRFG